IGMRVANLLFSRAWLFHAAQKMGRIGARFFTRRDGWIHALPSVGAKWTQTRDLRGMPKQTFHEWWEKNREQGTGIRDQKSREQGSKRAREQEGREQGNEGTRERTTGAEDEAEQFVAQGKGAR
ncbi:MAG: hypothetical protein WB567_12170, partial [Terracidiphilus sp.]